ncbi:hypothetical protein [Streptomyces sp. APSN-46.1]|nr:hypothetical protein [Streptomyces sp. APSN-46.1]
MNGGAAPSAPAPPTGKPVTLKVELTDPDGVSVTRTVARAYGIR